MICKTCKYFEKTGDVGKCHRFPPESDHNGNRTVDMQPIVREDDWCGEHDGRTEKKS